MKQHAKQKVLVIVGPTASGKSDLAVTLAKHFNGEVISADSRQVYKGLDIGSGKITKREMRGVPHHLLDVRSPRSIFSVADFVKLGTRAIADIHKRGKLPIIAGGTGMYVDALVYQQSFPAVPPNAALRATLEQLPAETLIQKLEQLDADRAAAIDLHNRVRVIRAIEIATALGSVPKHTNHHTLFDAYWIGTTWPDNILKERITTRLHARMKIGMLAEVKRLHKHGLSWKRMEALGLEYRYLARHAQGLLPRDEMLTELATKIWQYAKRQKTWFKRNKNIIWFEPTAVDTIITRVDQWLHADKS